MAKNEADIIATSVGQLVRQGCRVVVADNGSSDGTVEQIYDMSDVIILRDHDPAYHQAVKMTALAAKFAVEGEWVIPFDADELWWNLDRLDDTFDVATAHPHVHYGPCRQPGCEPHPKTAFRWRKTAHIEMGNHYVTGAGNRVADGLLEVCHYQYRSFEQVRRKVTQGVAAYDLTAMPKMYGAHWRGLATLTDTELQDWFDDYTAKATVPCQLSPL